jgi:hypothetical protein
MYVVQTYEEAIENLRESAREQFGEDFNVSSTSNWFRLLGLPISLLCVEKSQNIKDLEDRMSIYKATGTDLDDILSNFRFSRKQSSLIPFKCEASIFLSEGNPIKDNRTSLDILYPVGCPCLYNNKTGYPSLSYSVI